MGVTNMELLLQEERALRNTVEDMLVMDISDTELRQCSHITSFLNEAVQVRSGNITSVAAPSNINIVENEDASEECVIEDIVPNTNDSLQVRHYNPRMLPMARQTPVNGSVWVLVLFYKNKRGNVFDLRSDPAPYPCRHCSCAS